MDRFLSLQNSLLITPTATMAEHVRHELARAKVPVRPSRVTTLAQCLDRWTPLNPVSEMCLHFLIRQALEKEPSLRFAAVAEFPGFHRAVAALLEEVPAHAVSGVFEGDLARLFDTVSAALAARSMGLRNQRLRSCNLDTLPADTLREHLVFDGFFSFSAVELDFVQRIAARSTVTLTLPDWPGNAAIRQSLLSHGFIEKGQTEVHRKPRSRVLLCAPTLERETEEIARRIIEEHSQGRPFGEMGIILRARDPYLPALETALARFGIPARSYFTDRLDAHPAVQYLSGVVRTMLQGWDHASLLALLRMPVSGVGATAAGDRLDFELRRRLPGTGLPVRGLEDYPEVTRVLRFFDTRDSWRRDQLAPEEWARRFKSLRELLPEPIVTDSVSRDQVRIWRSTEGALEAFESAIEETAPLLGDGGRMNLEKFWRHAEAALALAPIRTFDRRRDVVHILDVFEARQWELPVVFVCGLVERYFPQYHREDPLLSDAARRRTGLKTSEDRQGEERCLFDLAVTRATEKLILSYPRLDDRGEETLPTFFLQGMEATPCETRVRPRPVRVQPDVSSNAIGDPVLRERLVEKHKTLAPTSIESFLQCPFQFFAAKTLRLKPRPAAPRDRLDLLLQGSILHRALAELARFPLLGRALLDQVFDDETLRARIPMTHRTEAVRLELLRHFEAFLLDRQVDLGWPSRSEEKFSFALNPLLTITGRIDRMDVGPHQQGLVIDYKYSAGNKIRERIEENGSGHLVQGGLYLLASQESFDLKPAGMLYCGLRKEVVWDGWHVPIPGLEAIGEVATPDVLNELITRAASTAADTFEAITSGRIAPRPADTDKCRWCDFRDICRIESAEAALKAEAR
ncbi:MAG: PD-(D/E)XK nuclease family protein [Bryobacteraceae bacterium]